MPKENGEPNEKAQLNFTDKDSKILKTSDGFVQGYNCQLAVDSANQIIVAHATLNEQCDTPQLPSIVCQIKMNTGRQAQELSAGLSLGGESPRTEAPAHPWVCGDETTETQHNGHSTAEAGPEHRPAHGADDPTTPPRRLAEPVPAPEGGRGARDRADQAEPRVPVIPAARPEQGAARVGPRLHRAQPDQADGAALGGGAAPLGPSRVHGDHLATAHDSHSTDHVGAAGTLRNAYGQA
jgi:hypothetical protein